jgi:diguanylate cyclase (GGDEF)-like protein/PAS domain S-box-containing protein
MTGYKVKNFFDLSLDMFCIAGPDGFFKRVNPSFHRVLGWTSKELLSRPFTEFIHPDDVAETIQEYERQLRGNPVTHFENRYLCKDGTYRYLMWTAYPEVETGLIYAVARDNTEKKLTEDKLALITTELERSNEKLLKLAAMDPLTGLFNRRIFDGQLDSQIRLMKRMNKTLSLLMLDIDHFKQHNDQFGHMAGDDSLKEISNRISRNLRKTDIVARYGGEEIAVILPDTSRESTIKQAEKLRKAVHDYGKLEKSNLTVSIGASTIHFDNGVKINVSEIKSKIISEADQALYFSKKNGRDRVTHYFDH